MIMYDWVDLVELTTIQSTLTFPTTKILWEEWTFFIWNCLNPITTISQVQVSICLQSTNINLYLCLQMVVYRYEIQCFHKYFAKSLFVLIFVLVQDSSQAPTRGSSPLLTTEQVHLKTKGKFMMIYKNNFTLRIDVNAMSKQYYCIELY